MSGSAKSVDLDAARTHYAGRMRLSSLFLIMVAVGCGGSDDTATPDAPPIDAPDDAAADAAIECDIATRAFGDLGERAGTASMEGSDGNGLATIWIPLNQDPLPDWLVFGTWGTANDPITSGTFQLVGANTNPRLCDVCLSAHPDFAGNGVIDSEKTYFAVGGTARFTVDPNPSGAVELELTNVRLHHIRIVNDQPQLHWDGCDTTIDRLIYRGTFAKDGSS
jgi:hypothetical protein